MGQTAHCDTKTFKPDLDELEDLLRRCRTVQEDVSREVGRFKESRDVLDELLESLNHSSGSSSNQICLVRSFPQWLKELIQYLSTITSNLPQILQAINSFDLDAMKTKLAALETCLERANESSICITSSR